jgi:hypothetical protein
VRPRLARLQAWLVVALVLAGGAFVWMVKAHPPAAPGNGDNAVSSQSKRPRGLFYPTTAQWATASNPAIR